jgi:superfamily II DNA or RNA helicase
VSLAALDLKLAYHKGEDDIAGEFYLPCMERSRRYDRAVGFFSSSIYVLAWPSLRQFVRNGGSIRLICSAVLSAVDVDALHDGYGARTVADFAADARAELVRLLGLEHLVKPTKVLATLVATGVIDLKVAWVGQESIGRDRRLFHDKVGIFDDGSGNQVAFKGSMNETWPGLAADGNLESVDVFATWRSGSDSERIRGEVEYFQRLWNGVQPGVRVTPFPEVALDDLRDLAEVSQWEEYVDEICLELESAAGWSADRGKMARTPRPHQVAALTAWSDRGRRGIFEHATGSGKTFTALCALRDSLERGEVPLVLVPSDLLLKQWKEELRNTFSVDGLQLLVCGGGARQWSEGNRLRLWTQSDDARTPRVLLATMQTARSSEFRRLLRDGEHLFLVADEVHRLGSAENRRLLEVASGPRLGLSATPRRAGDPEGTSVILDYFQGVVPPPFTLQDAVRAGALTPYAYFPHRVPLDVDEQEQWDDLTVQIGKRIARQGTGLETKSLDDATRLLLIQRARVIKRAAAKVPLAASVLARHYEPGQRWIVYCEDQDQLGQVREAIGRTGIPLVFEYHTAMTGDAAMTLRMFEHQGGVTVAIRCLDEGVDIPTVSHALILASSRNPREFIQRRGRVLRRADGKFLAYVHDAIVVPGHTPDDTPALSMVMGELARAIVFGHSAINPDSVTELQTLAIEFGLDWRTLTTDGFEADDDE